ncbi:MAG: magnesium transporter, partial [Pseudomonadales bacterium]|nr:magnesium transporter [Pseudomonadales bacterium]
HSPMVYVTDRFGHYTGVVYLHDIIKALPHSPISELLVSLPSIRAESDLMTAAMEVENAETSALPVVNDNNIFLGCITLADAVWIVREESESVLMKTVGMNEDEDLFAPVKRSAKRRAVWLGINLLTAFLASWTIGLFGETLQQVVALAVLMPIVASMGGIAGSQTLTLVIRGIALGQISDANFKALLKKELRVGILNGVIWSVVVAIVAGLWFQNIIIALVIAIAIIINIAAAALSGVVIPVVLDRLKIDPALSGSVILTTVTDVVGFVAFLGTGTLLLIHA